MERARRSLQASLLVCVMFAALLSHICSACCNHPDPSAGTPPIVLSPPPTVSYGSPPTYGTPTPTAPVHHTPTPSHGSGAHHGGGTPPSNCGNPPTTPHHNPPSSGGGYHHSPPTSGGTNPPIVTPTTPSTPPVVVNPPTTPYVNPPSTTPSITPPSTPYVTPTTPSPGITIPSPPFDPNSPPIGGTCDFWRSHPGLIWGLFGWWGTTVGGAFGLTSVPGFGSHLNLLQALSNTRNDGIGALYRQGIASLLNSMVNKNFPFTTTQVRDSFVTSLGSNKAAAAQARIFKLANEGHLKPKV